MTSSSGPASSPSIWNRVVIAILVTETAERVAYFGFRAVLVLYFHNGLGLSESVSVSLYAAVSCGAYFSPLVGALLADSSWGRYRTIWTFSTLYTFGLCFVTLGAYHVSSTSVSDDRTATVTTANQEDGLADANNLMFEKVATFFGLFLACLGTGGIKPCVSAFGADQIVLRGSDDGWKPYESLPKHSEHSLDFDDSLEQEQISQGTSTKEEVTRFFNSFYFCINLGALSSFAIIPIIRAYFGFGAAFLVPTIFMSTALLVFLSQRKRYKHRIHDSSQPPLSRVLRTCFTLLRSKQPQHHFPLPTTEEKGRTKNSGEPDDKPDVVVSTMDHVVREDAQQVFHLMLFFPIFWMLYDQQGSVWTLQATHLNLHGLQPEQLQFLNPLEIMILIPLFDQIVYPWLSHHGFDIQPLRRIEYGMGLTVISFLASALLEYFIQTRPPNSVSLGWQIPQITIITVGEIFLNITGLELAYSQAPGNMQASILAIYLFMTAIGDGLAALLFATIFSQLSTLVTILVCAMCMTANMIFFHLVVRRWTRYKDLQLAYEENNQGLQLGNVSRGELS